MLLQTKNEYLHELVNVLKPYIVEHFQEMYNEVKSQNKIHKYILREFQNKLCVVSKWSEEQKQDMYSKIKHDSEWIEKLINSVFVMKTQVLTSIKSGHISVHIENPENFIHKCFLNTSRMLWKRPDILYHRVSDFEIQKKKKEFEDMIRHVVKETIRKSLPMKDILNTYLKEATTTVKSIDRDENHTYITYGGDQDPLAHEQVDDACEDDEVASEDHEITEGEIGSDDEDDGGTSVDHEMSDGEVIEDVANDEEASEASEASEDSEASHASEITEAETEDESVEEDETSIDIDLHNIVLEKTNQSEKEIESDIKSIEIDCNENIMSFLLDKEQREEAPKSVQSAVGDEKEVHNENIKDIISTHEKDEHEHKDEDNKEDKDEDKESPSLGSHLESDDDELGFSNEFF